LISISEMISEQNIMKLNDIEYYIDQIKSRGISIDDYNEWVSDFGFPLASIGEDGRRPFHELSSTSSKYNSEATDRKFDDLIKSHNGSKNINSFFHKCIRELGIAPPRGSNGSNGIQVQQQKKVQAPQKKQDEEEKYLYTWREVRDAEPEKTIWAYLTKGVNNGFVASSEAGKTTLLVCLAIAIVKGKSTFLGFDINAPRRRILYISSEDGIAQMKRKIESATKELDLPDDVFMFMFDTTDLADRLRSILSKYMSDLVIFDTWGDISKGKYDSENTRSLMTEIRDICREYGSTPVYVHHTNKASENIPEKSSIKGAGDFEQACRVVMFLTIYKESRWLCCVKGNPFPDDYKNTCHELNFDFNNMEVTVTGQTLPRREIVQAIRDENTGRPATEIDWESILDKPLKHKLLVSKIHEVYGLSISQAKARISSATGTDISKDENGLYCV